jgi:hypothetical protein
MNSAAHTLDLALPMKLLPLHLPDCRVDQHVLKKVARLCRFRHAPTFSFCAASLSIEWFHLSGTRAWSKPGKRRDPLAVELPKLRQFGDQGSRDYRPDARHRGEQVFFLAPGRRAAPGIVNALIKRRELLFERLDETPDALLQTCRRTAAAAWRQSFG